MLMRAVLDNLTFEKVLTLLVNIALILALVHYVITPLGRAVGNDVTREDTTAQTGDELQIGINN